jgi:CheY-like chemotaxis protein
VVFNIEQSPLSERITLTMEGYSRRYSLLGGESAYASMSNLAENESRGVQEGVRLESPLYPRRRPLSVLFVPGDTATIECCLEKFEKAQFTVRSDFVLSLAECTEQLQSQSYDVVVVEYPSAGCNGPQAIQFLHQNMHAIPVIFLTYGAGSECIAELSAQGMVDYVEREHIANLPMAVRRALKEKKLREELAEAGKALRHSQSLCRALMENPAYGICRCDGEGTILDVTRLSWQCWAIRARRNF